MEQRDEGGELHRDPPLLDGAKNSDESDSDSDGDFYSSVKSLFDSQPSACKMRSRTDTRSRKKLQSSGGEESSASADAPTAEGGEAAAEEAHRNGMERAHHKIMEMLGSTGFEDMKAVVRLPERQRPGETLASGSGIVKGTAPLQHEHQQAAQSQAGETAAKPPSAYDVRAWLHAQLHELLHDAALLYGKWVLECLGVCCV